jgi:hypothetical protein
MPGLLRFGRMLRFNTWQQPTRRTCNSPDPQHVVCNPRALATVEEAAAKGGARRQIVSGNLAEVNIEIFELGGPVAPSAPSTPTPTVQPILVLVLGNAAGTTPMASLALTSP